MSEYTYYLDGIEITDYIASEFNFLIEKSLAGTDRILLSDFTLDLFNIGGAFNPYNNNSIWYSADPYDSIVKIYDEFDNTVYSGKIRKIDNIDPKTNTVKLIVANDLDSILNKTFITIERDITPAQVIKNILIYYDLDQYLDDYTYNFTKNYQESIGLYIDADYFIDNTTSILQAINNLSEDFGADCFLMDGKLYIVAIDKETYYNAGYSIPKRALLSCSFYNDTDNIRNQGNYELGDNNFTTQIKDYTYAKDSRSRWGVRSFSSVNCTNSSDISTFSITGLQDVLQDRLWRLRNPRNYIQFEIFKREYAVPFDLLQVFKFDSTCEDLIGSTITDYNWQPVKVQETEDTTKVTAIRLI